MPSYSNVTVVAVLDNNGELHKINYEQLANLPSSMKNPHALIIFGQKYDGSNETTITPSLATSTVRGCVMPVAKTSEMNQDVGIDSAGKLYTKGVTVDQVVTAFSTNPVSGDGVRNYVTNNTTQINQTIQSVKEEVEKSSEERYNELRGELTTSEKSIDELKTSIEDANKKIASNKSDIDDLKTSNSRLASRVTTNEENINTNKQNITDLQTDLQEVKSRNIGYYFSSESVLLSWLSNKENQKLLGVGVCLYITGDTSVHYVWNGTQAEKVTILTDIVGGYMSKENPTGTGYIVMNNCTVASNSAAFGEDNAAQDLYSLVSGKGITSVNEYQTAVGRYNADSKEDEVFTVGYGDDDTHRKTIHYIGSDGTSHNIGDVTAFDENLDAPISADTSKARTVCTIANMPENVKATTDWDEFLSTVTLNDVAEYIFVYNGGHWNSSSYDFAYVSDQQTQYYPIEAVGITFDYTDGRIAEVPIDFVDGDTITVYAPLQKTISLREVYNTVNAMGLYVDEDGDVCQED